MNAFTFTYRSTPVAYRKTGTGSPLIVLHGWGAGGRTMMPLARELSGLRTCYVFDLPGFGDTPPPERAWAIDDYADMVEAFMEKGEMERADLLVHSFGGRIALKLCARPEGTKRFGKVLITGGAGMKPRRSPRFYLKKYTAKLLKAPFSLLPDSLRETALQRLRGTRLWKSLGSSDYAQLSGVMRETFVRSVTEYLEPCLPDISNEVLLLWGRDDDATPLYQARRMEQGIREAALVVIDRAGHYAFLDRPKHFAAIAQSFFKDPAL